MTLHQPIPLSRPAPGDCICEECMRHDLRHDQMSPNKRFGYPICKACADMILSGYVVCDECRGKKANTRRYHSVRGEFYNDWCIRCDGRRRVFVGVPQHLVEQAHGETLQ